jgi:transposase
MPFGSGASSRRAIECLVIDSASMQVNRRSRRAKTDRIDLAKLLRALIAWCRGERHVGRSSVFQLSVKKTCAARTASVIG